MDYLFELTAGLSEDKFRKVFRRVRDQARDLGKDEEYVDNSLAGEGIAVVYCNRRHKKKVQMLVNPPRMLNDLTNTDKLIRKLDKHIKNIFDSELCLDDFILSSASICVNIKVGSRANASAYLKVLDRTGKVKGFSPTYCGALNEDDCLWLSGNSNNIEFIVTDLNAASEARLLDSGVEYKEARAAANQMEGILQVEVSLTKPKAIRAYTESKDTAGQVAELSNMIAYAFLDVFVRIVPFGDFRKKDDAAEIIRSEITDAAMQKKMLRLLELIPEKKSLLLAQKAMNCRDIEKVMRAFAKINLSPVTLSKRQDMKKLKCLYRYLLDD